MTLLEVIVAIGLLTIAILNLTTLLHSGAVSRMSTSQQIEINELSIILGTLFNQDDFCNLNLQGLAVDSATLAPTSLQALALPANGSNATTKLIQTTTGANTYGNLEIRKIEFVPRKLFGYPTTSLLAEVQVSGGRMGYPSGPTDFARHFTTVVDLALSSGTLYRVDRVFCSSGRGIYGPGP
jgi:hypothetical protein